MNKGSQKTNLLKGDKQVCLFANTSSASKYYQYIFPPEKQKITSKGYTIVMMISGGTLFPVGIVISSTCFGIIIGIPMCVLGGYLF